MKHRTRTFERALKAARLMVGVSLVFAGCERHSTPEKRGEALTARAQALQTEVAKTESVSPAQRQAFDSLVADVNAYNASTKRFDITVERATFVTSGSNEAAFSSTECPNPQECCTLNCPPYPPNAPIGYFCMEDGMSFCDPRTKVSVCSYRCVKIWRIPGG